MTFEEWWNKNEEELYNNPHSEGDMKTAWNAVINDLEKKFQNMQDGIKEFFPNQRAIDEAIGIGRCIEELKKKTYSK